MQSHLACTNALDHRLYLYTMTVFWAYPPMAATLITGGHAAAAMEITAMSTTKAVRIATITGGALAAQSMVSKDRCGRDGC